MKICLASYDIGPHLNLGLIAKRAFDLGHEAVVLPAEKDLTDNWKVAKEIQGSDILVTGLASFETEADLTVASCALANNVPWVVLEDVPEACLRPKARILADKASAVILAHPAEQFRQHAVEFGYRPEILTYLGPPPQWRADYETTKAAMDANLRGSLQMIRQSYSFQPVTLPQSMTVLGYIGVKNPITNNNILKMLGAVLGNKFAIAFGKHPRERTERPEDEQRFAELFAERDEIVRDTYCVITDGLNGAKVVAISDIMLYSGSSTNGISGAMLGRRQIYYEDEAVKARIRKQTGQDHWFVAELGGAVKVSSILELADAIKYLSVSGELSALLNRNQQQNFPAPQDWDTETKIVRFLENLVQQFRI